MSAKKNRKDVLFHKKQKNIQTALSLLLSLLMVFTVISPISAFAVTLDSTALGNDVYLTSITDYTVAPVLQNLTSLQITVQVTAQTGLSRELYNKHRQIRNKFYYPRRYSG